MGHKLRLMILIGASDQEMLKQQLLNDMPKTSQDCSMEIHCEFMPDSHRLKRIFQANENCKSYSQTIIMFDEIWREDMCTMYLKDYQNVDYIYCLRYDDGNAVQDNCQALEVTETT